MMTVEIFKARSEQAPMEDSNGECYQGTYDYLTAEKTAKLAGTLTSEADIEIVKGDFGACMLRIQLPGYKKRNGAPATEAGDWCVWQIVNFAIKGQYGLSWSE